MDSWLLKKKEMLVGGNHDLVEMLVSTVGIISVKQ